MEDRRAEHRRGPLADSQTLQDAPRLAVADDAQDPRQGPGPGIMRGRHERAGFSSAITSARLAALLRKCPRTADVTMVEPGMRTPRIDTHRCSASTTTNTP